MENLGYVNFETEIASLQGRVKESIDGADEYVLGKMIEAFQYADYYNKELIDAIKKSIQRRQSQMPEEIPKKKLVLG